MDNHIIVLRGGADSVLARQVAEARVAVIEVIATLRAGTLARIRSQRKRKLFGGTRELTEKEYQEAVRASHLDDMVWLDISSLEAFRRKLDKINDEVLSNALEYHMPVEFYNAILRYCK